MSNGKHQASLCGQDLLLHDLLFSDGVIRMKTKPKNTTLGELIQKLRKMDDAERTAFLLVEILRAQGDACLNRGKIESVMRKLGVKDEMAYENIHIAMQNRADAILERENLLDAEI